MNKRKKNNNEYSANKISQKLICEVKEAILSVKDYGSVEIYIQNSEITQITVRRIRKTNGNNNEKRGY